MTFLRIRELRESREAVTTRVAKLSRRFVTRVRRFATRVRRFGTRVRCFAKRRKNQEKPLGPGYGVSKRQSKIF